RRCQCQQTNPKSRDTAPRPVTAQLHQSTPQRVDREGTQCSPTACSETQYAGRDVPVQNPTLNAQAARSMGVNRTAP
ncbi:MAG: hypothetical protein AAFU85_07350, partial [Planctomycetota bacterium]